ncbi:MAG: hypothetical protein ACC658_16205, partial [Acidimicrobiia bacterium]
SKSGALCSKPPKSGPLPGTHSMTTGSRFGSGAAGATVVVTSRPGFGASLDVVVEAAVVVVGAVDVGAGSLLIQAAATRARTLRSNTYR